jgi:hypothetical protein
LRKFILRKRVISVILAFITSVLLATYPEQALDTLKSICKHLVVCNDAEKQVEKQTELGETK